MAIGTSIFTDILNQAENANQLNKLTGRSLRWFRIRVQRTVRGKSVSTRSFIADRERAKARVFIGRMYHFIYDAKLKDQLPYWDRFPLVFPVEMYSDGFLGINLHYLSPRLRARLMDRLSSTLSDKRLNERAKLRISYQLLSGAKKYRLFKPTLKRYLFSKVQSRFIQIDPQEWQVALFLPTEKFQKQTAKRVWSESQRLAKK
jgi:hypothetical protein